MQTAPTPDLALSSWELRARKDRELAAQIASRAADSLIGKTLADYPADEQDARAAVVLAAMDAGRDQRRADLVETCFAIAAAADRRVA
jgi:hypothetical protein